LTKVLAKSFTFYDSFTIEVLKAPLLVNSFQEFAVSLPADVLIIFLLALSHLNS